MNFEPILYGPLFIRDAQDINLVAASADPVNLTVSVGGSSWTIPVTPVLTNNRYLAALRMREILSSVVGIPGLANAGEREVPLVTLSAGDATMSVRAVYGAASGKTPTQLAGHWLSWRDQVSMTHAWGRERLTFLAGLDLLGWQSGTYSVKAKIFLSSGDPVTVTLTSGTLQSGCRYVTVDASYAAIAAAVSSSVRSKIRAWDVSYSFSGTDSQSAAATINGYPLRLIIARDEVRVKEFVFCNSFGVEDRVYSSGRSNPKLDGSSVAFLSGASEYELRNDSTEGREVYSGRLGSARESALWLDFLKAHDRYILASGGLARIIVDSQETDLQDNALGSVKFTYHLGALDNGRYFNDQEGLGDYDPTQRHGALYIGDEPPSEELPSEDLFFLKTRLDEFPVADLSEEYLFLVQDPLTLEWCSAPLSDIKEWLQQVITHEDVHVWSGPWEDYSAGVADYALAASLGRDLYDRILRIEQNPYDLPIASDTVLGGVKVGSGLSIDGSGVLSVDASEVIDPALQSLQAQLDAVASRDAFDELTATTAFIDTLAADRVYANRYYFTHDIYFYIDVVDGTPCVHLNADFITDGDQILGDGTPGGGGGGALYFHELLDVAAEIATKTSDELDGKMLVWDKNAVPYGSTSATGAWTICDAPTGSITSVTLLEGSANGTLHLNVNGTNQEDVHVHGLGSLAYKDSLVASDIPDLSATYQPKDADLTAIAGLTGTSGVLKKTAANTWALDTNIETYASRGNTAYSALDIIGPALQSLQAQIDSVATKTNFDELTATALAADIVAASYVYAERYYLTNDIYFYIDVVDGTPCVHLNADFITDGDQILGDGTPGGGGGGGVTYFSELQDVSNAIAEMTSQQLANKMLIWDTAATPVGGSSATGAWSVIDKSSVGITTDATQNLHGLMSAADKIKLDGINTTYIANGETAYEALNTIGPALQSLQAQLDSVASRDAFDELTANAIFADVIAASDIYAALHGSLEGNAATATDADKLDGQHGSYYATAAAVTTIQGYFTNGVANNADKVDGIHASDLFSAMSSGAATNFSITIGGTNKTATLYATYDSASENISDKFGVVGSALQSLQGQIDAVASRVDLSDYEATTEAKMDYICDLLGSLQAQIDSVSTRIDDGSCGYFDMLAVGGDIYADYIFTTGDQELSDERKKNITREIVLTAEQIASCRAVAFDWKDKPGSSFGSIAQDWQKILPESVRLNGDTLYLSSNKSALVAIINIAREVVELRKQLEQRGGN